MKQFREAHIGEDCRDMTGLREDGLFFDCTFDRLSGLTLKDCDLNGSKFETASIGKALGFTLTLGCHSFDNVEYSPLLVDLLLYLLTTTKGNDARRQQLLDMLGPARVSAFNRVLDRIET